MVLYLTQSEEDLDYEDRWMMRGLLRRFERPHSFVFTTSTSIFPFDNVLFILSNIFRMSVNTGKGRKTMHDKDISI